MAKRIFIIEEHNLFKSGLTHILLAENFKVDSASYNDNDLLSKVEIFRADLIILGVNDTNGKELELINEITKCFNSIKIIVLSNINNKELAFKYFLAGVRGYLLKEVKTVILIEAIKSIIDGGAYLNPQITNELIQEYKKLSDSEYKQIELIKPFHLLTFREVEILQLLADGKSNRGISEVLKISEKTVKNHVSSILEKIKVNDRTNAVLKAIKNNWVKI